MSIDQRSLRQSSSTTSSRPSVGIPPRQTPPPATLTPENTDQDFEACAATGSFFLYAQRNSILVLHHDTLAIERRFELHREDVRFIHVDNVSERGSGRLAVSYDIGNTAIVWDIFSGSEVSRFSAYDPINVACFMRNGNIAFGNNQGSIILFEPSTSEHISARTIFDPITAIAPAADCRTFAIGYLNGSILVATIHPAFTIQHTLTTSRPPSKIAGLAWHGASSKSKTDMLATQTQDGDLRVWSVPKAAHAEQPMIIRVLNRGDMPVHGPNWFAWSKNGRIVQHLEGETRAWDVRTKKVTFDVIPTLDNIAAITNYGPTATLFTIGRNHTVQQYDINPNNSPSLVQSVRHAPANTPPTPPTNLEEHKNPYSTRDDAYAGMVPMHAQLTDNDSSENEGGAMSPLEKIAREMESLDAMESEIRDKVMPLSPTVSSRASSVSSKSSGRHFRQRKYLYDRPESSRASSTSGYDGTEFSYGVSLPQNRESMSIRSSASVASSKMRSSHLRNQILRSPQEAEITATMDLFPITRARLKEVDFRTPHYGNSHRTPDLLRREMLSVVFGWNDDVSALIRDELARHRAGSAAGVLLSKWLGDIGADSMAAMVGSESMTSSDWMLLALSSIDANSKKKAGEAFVQRLLEKGDIHPAVAILLGLGEQNDAIEVYVSQGYWMEALLLCCLTTPMDWGRQSYLLRQWGPVAVQEGNAELAVRIFSCASVESTESWFSPRAQQDVSYAAAQQKLTEPLSAISAGSNPISSPARSVGGRLTAKNASLKLITSFGDRAAAAKAGDPTPLAVGVTPIAESAVSPRGGEWQRLRRDNSEVRTATPGGYTTRKRLPSRSDIERAKAEAAEMATPLTAARDRGARLPSRSRRTPSTVRTIDEPATAIEGKSKMLVVGRDDEDHLPSPSAGAFNRLREGSRPRMQSRTRSGSKLAVEVMDVRYDSETMSPGAMTGVSLKSAKSKAIDDYISSVEEARVTARAESKQRRAQSRNRNESRSRAASRPRDPSESRKPRQIRRSKGSPSSPVPMSPDNIAQSRAQIQRASLDDEDFYRIASPVDSTRDARMSAASKQPSQDGDRLSVTQLDADRGRTDLRTSGSSARSPSAPIFTNIEPPVPMRDPETESDGRRVRTRAASIAQDERQDIQTRRAASRARNRSGSRRPAIKDSEGIDADTQAGARQDVDVPAARPRAKTREAAAKELEERRLSLARRPSAPPIPLPADLTRSINSRQDLGGSPMSYMPPFPRSHTVDPDAMQRQNKITGTSTPSAPIGLPATPRAMRHPKYMSANPDKDDAPPVPIIPENLSQLSGSMLSQVTGSNLSQAAPSSLSQVSSSLTSDQHSHAGSTLGPLLPATVYTGPPTRAASAPPEKQKGGLPSHPAYNANLPSTRRLSRDIRKSPEASSGIASIDEQLSHASNHDIIIIPEEDTAPVMLPELQHLAGPPPPPPAPSMFSRPAGSGLGVINIAIEGNDSNVSSDMSSLSMAPSQFPSVERAMTTSPSSGPSHRRGRGSIGGTEGFGARMRGMADRMRSSSRTGRVKSPPLGNTTAAPYETRLAHEHGDGLARARSPYEQAMASQSESMIPVPPPPPSAPPLGLDAKLNEMTIPPQLPGSVYRNPKEIRANMPPEFTQAGVQGGFL